jgi:hypothetical protein
MPDMDENALMRELLVRAAASEPPIGPMPRNALLEGMKMRRHRRFRVIAAGAAGVAVVCVASLTVTATIGNQAAGSPDGPTTAYVLGGRTVGTVTPISAAGTPGQPIEITSGRPFINENMPGYSQLALSPDGKTVWASDGGTVVPISTATNTAGAPVTVVHQSGAGDGIEQVLMAPDGKTLYALGATATTSAVTPISTATHRAGRPIDVGPGTLGFPEMTITPNGKALYVVFLSPPGTATSYVIPISTVTDRAGKPIQLSQDVTAVVAAADGKTVYLVGQPRPKGTAEPLPTVEVTPIATATNTLGKPIVAGSGALGLGTPVVTTPDGRTMYIVEGSPDDVIPFSLATNTPGKPISLGTQLITIAMAPDGRTAYVLSVPPGGFYPGGPHCGNAPGAVTPITTATNTAGTPIKLTVGCNPLEIGVTTDGRTVYVVSNSGVTPVSAATGRAGTRINIEMPEAILTVPPEG